MFTPVMLVISFFLSQMVYGHYALIPVDDISTADRFFVMAWDIGVTGSLHGACAYHLSKVPARFRRAWGISVLVGCIFVVLECAFRGASIGFGEPIYRMVADMMTVPLFLLLPLIGIGSGIAVRGWKQF